MFIFWQDLDFADKQTQGYWVFRTFLMSDIQNNMTGNLAFFCPQVWTGRHILC
jgi:hypothetical protein